MAANFQSETAVTIDAKGRMAIPTAYREAIQRICENHLVVVYNPFELGCLWLYPRPQWERLRDQVNKLPRAKRANRDMQMKVVGAAAMVDLDSAARILLPASQRAATGIEKKAILMGMGDRLDIWSEKAHLAKIHQPIGEDQISEEILGLAL
jgi:MraZ protein